MTRLVHFEIHVDDFARAQTFYGTIFGWTFQKWGEMEYHAIITGPQDQPGINGGMVKRRGPAPKDGDAVNAFVCTMVVPDIDATQAAILKSGGIVALEKMAIPGAGWLAYYKDLDHNIFGVMQDDKNAK